MTSTKALFDHFEQKGELLPGIIFDLFGYINWTSSMLENKSNIISLFLGLYKGLYIMGVSHKEIYRCFLKNKLDDLMHIKYSIHKSKYYKDFCEQEIKIGNTFITDEEEEESSDDEESNNEEEPIIYSTIQPPYHFIHSKTEICESSIGCEDQIISNKINSYKNQDKLKGRKITSNYATINDVKKLLFKQENKCYVCGDNVITEEWQPKCLYQFTLDRIDNNLPHNKDNVLICCHYCNCFGWQKDNTDVCLYKLCENKCHTIKRNIARTRDNVSKKESKKLLIA